MVDRTGKSYKMLKYATVACSIPVQIMNLLDSEARAMTLSRGGLIRQIITDWLESKGHKVDHLRPQFADNVVSTYSDPEPKKQSEVKQPPPEVGLDHVMNVLGLGASAPTAKKKICPEELCKHPNPIWYTKCEDCGTELI